MSGGRGHWASLAMLMLGSISLAAIALLVSLPHHFQELYLIAEENLGPLAVPVTPPLLLLVFVLWVRWECEAGYAARSPGDLEKLIHRKRLGRLQAGRRLRSGSAHDAR